MDTQRYGNRKCFNDDDMTLQLVSNIVIYIIVLTVPRSFLFDDSVAFLGDEFTVNKR